jgi:hypothetical protein
MTEPFANVLFSPEEARRELQRFLLERSSKPDSNVFLAAAYLPTEDQEWARALMNTAKVKLDAHVLHLVEPGDCDCMDHEPSGPQWILD